MLYLDPKSACLDPKTILDACLDPKRACLDPKSSFGYERLLLFLS